VHVERHEAALLPVRAEVLPRGARQLDEHILQLHDHMRASGQPPGARVTAPVGRYPVSSVAIVLDGVESFTSVRCPLLLLLY
jgi:hypothetical protein